VGLLRPKDERRPVRQGARTATVVTCPYNGHQVGWCRGLCTPVAGVGACGRPAAHALMGRTQRAIAAQIARQLAAGD
jgi:hypothetical protein